MRPGPQLAAEAGAEELRDDANLLARNAEDRAHDFLMIHYRLGRFVEREPVAVRKRDRCVQLDRIVRLGCRYIDTIDRDRRSHKGSFGIAALTLDVRLAIRS